MTKRIKCLLSRQLYKDAAECVCCTCRAAVWGECVFSLTLSSPAVRFPRDTLSVCSRPQSEPLGLMNEGNKWIFYQQEQKYITCLSCSSVGEKCVCLVFTHRWERVPAVSPAGRSESLFFSWKQNHGTNLAADPSLSAEENLFNVCPCLTLLGHDCIIFKY